MAYEQGASAMFKAIMGEVDEAEYQWSCCYREEELEHKRFSQFFKERLEAKHGK